MSICRALLLFFAGIAPSFVISAHAEPKPVRIVVPAPPGGALDGSARILARKLAALSGEPYVVENRPGAQTIIGTSFVVQAPPDGRTLLWASTSLVINPLLQKVPYLPFVDLKPVAGIAVEPFALVASGRLKVASMQELHSGSARRLNCAGAPGAMSLGCEELRYRWGDRTVVVPYPGVAPVLQALAGGHVDLAFVSVELAQGLIRGGQAKVLALSRRSAEVEALQPGTPLLRDVFPDLLVEGLYGVYAPAATPPERLQVLEELFTSAMRDPAVVSHLRSLGLEVLKTPAAGPFAAELRAQEAAYTAWVRKLGLGRD